MYQPLREVLILSNWNYSVVDGIVKAKEILWNKVRAVLIYEDWQVLYVAVEAPDRSCFSIGDGGACDGDTSKEMDSSSYRYSHSHSIWAV